MHIIANFSGHASEPLAWTDVDGGQWCVAVVKGAYHIDVRGRLQLADAPATFVYADEHHGDPSSSSLRFEADFAPFKPMTDVVVVGHAHAPDARPCLACDVALQVGRVAKMLRVHGTRVWTPGVLGLVPSKPTQPFETMPLRWELAYGGANDHGCEWHNPVGVGLADGVAEHQAVGTRAHKLNKRAVKLYDLEVDKLNDRYKALEKRKAAVAKARELNCGSLPEPPCNVYRATPPGSAEKIEKEWDVYRSDYLAKNGFPSGTKTNHRVPKTAGGCPGVDKPGGNGNLKHDSELTPECLALDNGPLTQAQDSASKIWEGRYAAGLV